MVPSENWPAKHALTAILVMPGLVPGIHVFLLLAKTWMAGTSPAMTKEWPYSLLSTFQKIGVAGPSSTPVIDFRQALGIVNCPSGM